MKPTARPYNDMTPTQRAEVDRQYKAEQARAVLRVTPQRIERLQAIRVALLSEIGSFENSADDGYAYDWLIRASTALAQSIQGDERRVAMANADLDIIP